jgi:hypothetical protein
VPPVGRSLLRTLVATSEREGVDVATLTAGLIWLGGRQEAYLYRQQRPTPDDAPNTTVGVVCLACGRARQDGRQRCCGTCGGSWTTRLD